MITNIAFYQDIIDAVEITLFKRGWSSRGNENLYNPFYKWSEHHADHNEIMHHDLEHPVHGLIIYRGFFFNIFANNTKGIDKKELEYKWGMDKSKYGQFIIDILMEDFSEVMIKYDRKRMSITFSSESYKQVDLDKNQSLKSYMIFNKK